MARLEGKTAFITGSGSGIGRAAALLFARDGAAIAVAEISEAAGTETVELIRAAGGTADFLHVDVTDEDSVSEAIRQTVARRGRLDILYNNAGGSSDADGTVTEVSVAEFWRTMRVEVFGTFFVCRFGIPELIKAGGGAIINTSSTTALRGVPRMHAYSTAKGGIISMTRTMAIDYAEYGIRVNAIAPGGIRTARVAKRLAGSAHAAATQGAHLLGIGTAEDAAKVALFLASDEAGYMTGELLVVDGGWCAASPGLQAKPRERPQISEVS
jgi:NAD(P)-dependent dehydrogenase (short-subunit alcohol dehydrogenase family)